jgi:ABC-type Fe3+-hydroxamate transport system substrate-binding protein
LLYSLGLRDQVVGITKFCVHPDEWFRTKTRVGGTKQLNLQLIRELKPDVIIANKEENLKEQIDELANDFPVCVTDVHDLASAYEMIMEIGRITGVSPAAEDLVIKIRNNFSGLTAPVKRLKACYLIWKDPYMTVGGDTFIHSMLLAAGFANCFGHLQRYPEVSMSMLMEMHCDVLVLSSEPFPFKEDHVNGFKRNGFKGDILLVDGEMFSWYGSRMLHAPGYFRQVCTMVQQRLNNG